MKYHTLTGLIDNKIVEKKSSRLIMGTAHLNRFECKEQRFAILDEFIKVGGNTFDTAHQYLDSEILFGEWIAERNNRRNILILSKGAHPDDGEPGPRLNPSSITSDITESLMRLRTNYLDLYALHRDDESVEVGPIIETLNQHIEAGRIHAIGASNWTHKRIQEANDYAAKAGLIGFTFNSPNLSLASCNIPRWPGCVSVDRPMLNWHKGTQLPLLSWSSQAGGFFSGRFAPDILDNEEMVRVYYSEANWERFERARKLAKKKGASAIRIALAYVLNQPFLTAAIIGPEKVEELVSSVEALNIELTSTEMKWLNLEDSFIGNKASELTPNERST
ncbi:aldo/keto reductase [Sutcliffiella halmapala]|uniref:aldo/keto reductase n=1 Tax=Sutcliffiella halmapala TaxID=79882 RepID=UPI0009954162|nr:aldo/keto reductase [Sutcliffiella halmapala]